MPPMSEGRTTEQLIRDANWNRRELMICGETLRSAGMNYVADAMEDAANNIEYLIMKLERLLPAERRGGT